MHSILNTACITILGNDDPHGVFRFDMSSLEVAVDEAGDTVTNDNSKTTVLCLIVTINRYL